MKHGEGESPTPGPFSVGKASPNSQKKEISSILVPFPSRCKWIFRGAALVPDKNCAVHTHPSHPTKNCNKTPNIRNFKRKEQILPSPSEDFGGSLALLNNKRGKVEI